MQFQYKYCIPVWKKTKIWYSVNFEKSKKYICQDLMAKTGGPVVDLPPKVITIIITVLKTLDDIF